MNSHPLDRLLPELRQHYDDAVREHSKPEDADLEYRVNVHLTEAKEAMQAWQRGKLSELKTELFHSVVTGIRALIVLDKKPLG